MTVYTFICGDPHQPCYVHFRAESRDIAIERAKKLAESLLRDAAVDTQDWGLHLGAELIACDE